MRRWLTLVLAMLMLMSSALAELSMPQDTPGEIALAEYIARVNDNLLKVGSQPVNSVFMCFPTLASLGVTDEDNAEIPEKVEMTFQLYQTGLNILQLRVCDPDLFATLAAACIQAASPDQGDMAELMKSTLPYAARVKKSPGNSFEDTVIEQNGDSIRAYYAYYPDQYHDGVSWLQLTLIFPLYGFDGGLSATPMPDAPATDEEYVGIDVKDNYNHFEVFATATPEPDSPAGESGSGI